MLGLPGLLLLGIGAQWLAWRLRIPSILLLLLLGFAVGPFSGLLDPGALLGEELHPVVSLAVAVILFEGGLSLRFRELKGAGRAVAGLILVGPVLTFGIVTFLARWTLGFEPESSALVGAILVVTGPTVIGPLLQHVRPTGVVGKVVRWEGIVTDPIGAILAVLVYQAFLHGEHEGGIAYQGLARAIAAGGGLGVLCGLATRVLLEKKLVPDFLHAPVAMALAVASFVGANRIQHESGLLAVTVMGILLANQRRVVIEHILEFEENLRVILVSVLFLLLAANVELEELRRIDLKSLGFVILLIVVARPLVVLLSTLGTGLTWAEKAFVAWMAPRGIVAAAVASVFAGELDAERFPLAARQLVPVTFLVIIGTVAVYGSTAAALARRLGLSRGVPNGVFFVGAHAWARKIAKALAQAGIDVQLADTNHAEVQAARIDGLKAHYGSALADEFELRVPFDGFGHFLSLTYNDQVNSLACLHFAPVVGRGHVHQLRPDDAGPAGEELAAHLRGQVLFDERFGFWELEARFRAGAVVKTTRLGEGFGLDEFRATYDRPEKPAIPLFFLRVDGRVDVVSADEVVEWKSGDRVVALVDEPAA